MTLDEAIKHAEEVVESCERGNPKKRSKSKCASEHRQLAEWLKELKALKAEPCEDAISREAALLALTGVNLLSKKPEELISLFDRRIKELPSVIPKQKTGKWIELKDQKPEAYEDVLVRDIDGDVTCAYLCDDTDFLERFSGEIIDDIVEWMEIPG